MSLANLKKRTEECLSDWIKACRHVQLIEEEYWRRDALMEEELERIVIDLNSDRSEEDETDVETADVMHTNSTTDTGDSDWSTDTAEEEESGPSTSGICHLTI